MPKKATLETNKNGVTTANLIPKVGPVMPSPEKGFLEILLNAWGKRARGVVF